jgi:hypothetical protein
LEEKDCLDEATFFLAIFDVVGFSNLVNNIGGKAILKVYQKLTIILMNHFSIKN